MDWVLKNLLLEYRNFCFPGYLNSFADYSHLFLHQDCPCIKVSFSYF